MTNRKGQVEIENIKPALNYQNIFNMPPPENRLEIIQKIPFESALFELVGLNYRLKSNRRLHADSSIQTQFRELKYFVKNSQTLEFYLRRYSSFINEHSKIKNINKNNPIIFFQGSCLFGMEEILSNKEFFYDNSLRELNEEDFENILKYLLAVSSILTIDQLPNQLGKKSIEEVNPHITQINEHNVSIDYLSEGYRALKLHHYLKQSNLQFEFIDYFNTHYNIDHELFILQGLKLYMKSDDEVGFEFLYNSKNIETSQFLESLSQDWKSSDYQKLIRIKKYPFYKMNDSQFLLLNGQSLLNKLYDQFLNDFWFDYLKPQGIKIQDYKSVFGRFFENYFTEIAQKVFSHKKYYQLHCLDELKKNLKGGEHEFCDFTIKYQNKLVIGEIKSAPLYDKEKYSQSPDEFYMGNRQEFFEKFGVIKVVEAIQNLNELSDYIPNHLSNIKLKNLIIYPIIVYNDRALQTPYMAKVFNDYFQELMKGLETTMIIRPLSLMHISDLENMTERLILKPNLLWSYLKLNTQNKKFIPPFCHTVDRIDKRRIKRPNYMKVEIQQLIEKQNLRNKRS